MSTDYTPVTDPKEALALVKAAATAWRSTERKQRDLQPKAAYATACYDKAGGFKDEAQDTYAARFDTSKTNVTLWKRLGYAMFAGVTPEMPMWKVLAHRSGALDKAVGKAIMADGATVETIAAALATTRKADGSKIVAAPPAKPNDGTNKGTDVTIPATITDPLARVAAAVKALDTEMKAFEHTDAFNAETFSKVESSISKIITRGTTLLRKVAADKAKADKAAAA